MSDFEIEISRSAWTDEKPLDKVRPVWFMIGPFRITIVSSGSDCPLLWDMLLDHNWQLIVPSGGLLPLHPVLNIYRHCGGLVNAILPFTF